MPGRRQGHQTANDWRHRHARRARRRARRARSVGPHPQAERRDRPLSGVYESADGQARGGGEEGMMRRQRCVTPDLFRGPTYHERKRWWIVGCRNKPGMTVEAPRRSEEHTSELQSLMRISYAVFCSKKNTDKQHTK